MLVTRCCVLDNVTVYAADDVIFCLFQMTSLDQTGVSLVVLTKKQAADDFIFCLFQMTSLDQTGVSLVVLTKKLAWVAEVGEQVYQLLR